MTKRAARRKGSVLTRQKPKKRGKTAQKSRLRRLAIGSGIVVAVALTAWGWSAARRYQAGAVARRGGEPRGGDTVDWKVSLKLAGSQALPEPAANEILELAKKSLGHGTTADLEHTAALVQRLDAYSQVHVLRLSADEVAVEVRLRVPVLCIEADRWRFVSAEADVYGLVPEGPAACPGPLLSGVFEGDKSKLTLKSDFTLSLTDEDKTAIREALELWRDGKERAFPFATLNFKKYRGFFVTLPAASGEPLAIAVGRAPFAAKLDKLKGILAKLANKGEQAARIELDYQGKAFIKLKKM